MAKYQQRPQQKQQAAQTQSNQAKKIAPIRRPERRERVFSDSGKNLLFGRRNFILFGVGLALVFGGLLLMTGGAMPDPMKWEPERIYSFRRITLAPICMVAGFVVVIFGIFAKNKPENTSVEAFANNSGE